MKKDKLVKNYLQGRESCDDPYAMWKEEGQKENFSLFSKPSTLPRDIQKSIEIVNHAHVLSDINKQD